MLDPVFLLPRSGLSSQAQPCDEPCNLAEFPRRGLPLHLQVGYSSREIVKIVTIYEPDAAEWIEFRARRRT